MFAACGQARAAGRARLTRVSAALLLLTTLLLTVSLTQAAASPTIASKRAEAKQVARDIQDMQSRLEKQIERYDAVHQQYLDTRRKLRDNKVLLAVAKTNLARAQQLLADSLTNSYKTSNQDVVSYLLASHSFNELVDHMQVLQRSNDANSALISQIVSTKHEIAVRTAALKTQTAQLRSAQAEQLAAKHRVEAGLHQLQARQAHISADIQHLIDQAQARADAAAQARATSSGGGGDVNIPIPPSSTLGGQAVAIAMQYLGTPYVWGGASPSGFDCSGFTMYVWGQLGVSLPHNAAAQYSMGTAVPSNALEPGDLVFFDGLGHVGMYVGNGAFIHAPHTGDVVKISSLTGWYADNYVGARRVA